MCVRENEFSGLWPELEFTCRWRAVDVIVFGFILFYGIQWDVELNDFVDNVNGEEIERKRRKNKPVGILYRFRIICIFISEC